MGVYEAVALSVILLLALYGCTCLIKKLTLVCLKPKKEGLFVAVRLDELSTGVEQQVRYARAVALQSGWQLYVVDGGLSVEQRAIVDRLLCDGSGERVVKKNDTCSCNENKMRV